MMLWIWILIVIIVFLTVIIITGYCLISDVIKMFIKLSIEVDDLNKEIDKLRKVDFNERT